MTTGPAGKHSTSGACSARSRTAANPLPSRSASDGWSSGPTPGSTTSADSVAAPNAARPASTPTSPWPPPSSPSVHCGGPHGSSTAGTPGQDHRASADLLADALSVCLCALGLGTLVNALGVIRDLDKQTRAQEPCNIGPVCFTGLARLEYARR